MDTFSLLRAAGSLTEVSHTPVIRRPAAITIGLGLAYLAVLAVLLAVR